MENLKTRFRNLSSTGAIRIESEDFSVENISANQLVVCSIHSNVMVEASVLGFRFVSFDVGSGNLTRINQYLPESKDLCIFKEGRIDRIKLQSFFELQNSSYSTPNQMKVRLGFEIDGVRRKLRMSLTRILTSL
jgi:hypothetical protein